jgi:hypothetical protein
MEIKFPNKEHNYYRSSCGREILTVRVILAIDSGGGTATSSAIANDSDICKWYSRDGAMIRYCEGIDIKSRGLTSAGQPNKSIHILNNDADGLENTSCSGIAGLGDSLAANISWRAGGGRKGGEGKKSR